jgi:hypothetical protein
MEEQERAASGDVYEREYMKGEGGVLYRDKFIAPWQFHAVMALPLLIMALSAVFTAVADPANLWATQWPVLVTLPFFVIIWLLFSVLRVTVSEEQVVIQYGVFGPKVAVESIVSAEAVDYDWKRFGGWGVRRGVDGSWAYNMMGDAGRAVKLVYRDAKGEHTVYVSTTDATSLARRIKQAMASKGMDVGAQVDDEVVFEHEVAVEEQVEASRVSRGG